MAINGERIRTLPQNLIDVYLGSSILLCRYHLDNIPIGRERTDNKRHELV
jgi:hypothetical protein